MLNAAARRGFLRAGLGLLALLLVGCTAPGATPTNTGQSIAPPAQTSTRALPSGTPGDGGPGASPTQSPVQTATRPTTRTTPSIAGSPSAATPQGTPGGPSIATPQIAPVGPNGGRLDTRLDLPLGQAVTFPAEGLTLRFTAVLDDSRCPRSANGYFVACAHAGLASIEVRAEHGGAAQTLTLVIAGLTDDTTQKPAGDKASATFAGYRIQLVRLEPQPGPTTRTPRDYRDYAVTLLVTRP